MAGETQMAAANRSGERRNPARRGVTLVEMLVVIALIGMLAALLTPALGRARERGRITTCTNNEYQIAFALLRYDEQKGSIPGWLNVSPNSVTAPCSWPVYLLPYLGRSDVADMWGAMPSPAPLVEQFRCPTTKVAQSVVDAYPPISYAGNAGANGLVANDGLFLNVFSGGVASQSLDDVADADGTSTTLAFSEKSARGFDPHRWDYSLTQTTQLFGAGQNLPPVFGVQGTPPTPPAQVINGDATTAFAPASGHPDGVVVAYCDGHTGFLSNTVPAYLYGQLLTPKSRWQGTTNKTNSTTMQPWLLKNGAAYLLDERDLKK